MNALWILAAIEFLPVAIGLAAVLGACVGSFLTLVTYRLPLDQPIGSSRSRCPQRGVTLRVLDLMPVVSWLLTRGRCRHCRSPIGIRYPLTELATAVGTALAVWHAGVSWEALALAGLWWCIVAIIVTDLEHYIILDEVQIAVGLFGILYGWALGFGAVAMALSAVVGVAIGLALKYGFILLRHKDGLGMGDIKFLGVAGVWLADAANFVPFLFFSGILGIASGLVWKFLGLGERFPFGPALALALLLCVLFPHIADGFWQLYGFVGQE